jgi:hypothetical protein
LGGILRENRGGLGPAAGKNAAGNVTMCGVKALKLTPEVTAQAAGLIRAGMDVDLAASQIGVSRSTWFAWQARGALEGRANVRYREFAAAIDRARAEREMILVSQVSKASAAGSWRASCWLLEREFPERWAPVSQRPADEPIRQPNAAQGIRDELKQRREQRDPDGA